MPKKTKLMNTTHKREVRSEDIFEKALGLFLEEGYDNTPMSKIAKALGMSKAGLYYYCSSKEKLLFLIHKDHLEKQLLPLIDESEKIVEPRERLIFFLHRYSKIFSKSPAARVLIHEINRLNIGHYRQIRRFWKRAFDVIDQAIKEMQKNGQARKVKDSFATFLAIGMCCWTFYWFDYSRPSSADELADTIVDIFFKGIEN